MTELKVGEFYNLCRVPKKVINYFDINGAGFTEYMIMMCSTNKKVKLIRINDSGRGIWYGVAETNDTDVDWWFPKEALIPTNKVDNVIEKIQWLYKNSTSQFEKRWVKE